MNSKRAISMSANEENKTKKNRAVNEISRLSAKIKSSKKYTPSIGDDLRIIGPDIIELGSEELKPVLVQSLTGRKW